MLIKPDNLPLDGFLAEAATYQKTLDILILDPILAGDRQVQVN
jgi:hypothetical protein